MDLSSALHALEGQQRNEYPFPVMDAVEPTSSPSNSSTSSPSSSHHHRHHNNHHHQHKSHRSGSQQQHRYDRDCERDRDRDHEQDHGLTSTAKLLSRLASREDRDIKHVRTLLVLTKERLESETRRADEAEQRVVDTLHRLRTAHEATAVARAEASRASETVRLYQLQLDYAQREITRAQEILNQVEQERAEAEAAAARARNTARRLREDGLITKAREQGRKEGYQEGLWVGRNMGVSGGRASPRGAGRKSPVLQYYDDEEEEEEEKVDEKHTRTRSPPRRTPSVSRPSPPPATYAPHPRLAVDYELRQRSTTPARVPSRVREILDHTPSFAIPVPPAPPPPLPPPPPQASSSRIVHPPSPVPKIDPNPRPKRPEITNPTPTPVRNAPPSPSHPPYDIIPDNWIPYANNPHDIRPPPPHELSRPVTPVSPNPSIPTTDFGFPVAPPSQETLSQIPPSVPPSIRSHDYGYPSRANVNPDVASTRGKGPMSPQSRTSTRISDMDILNLSSAMRGVAAKSMSSIPESLETEPSTKRVPPRPWTPGPSRIERPQTSLGHRRDQNEPPVPVPPRAPEPARSESGSGSGSMSSSNASRSELEARRRPSTDSRPLVQLFKRRFRSRTSPPGSVPRVPPPQSLAAPTLTVPDITVVSPSTAGTSSSSHKTTNAPHLLSPDYQPRPLPFDPGLPFRAPEPPLPVRPPPSSDVVSALPPGFVVTPTLSTVTPPTITTVTEMGKNRRPSGTPGARPSTPYAEAPLPPGIAYPDPPTGTLSPSTLDDMYGSLSTDRTAVATRGGGSGKVGGGGGGHHGGGLSGGLSPLSIGKPLPIFPFPIPGDDDHHDQGIPKL